MGSLFKPSHWLADKFASGFLVLNILDYIERYHKIRATLPASCNSDLSKKIKQNPKLIRSVTRILWRKAKPARIHSEVVRFNVICPNDRYTYIVYVRESHFCSFLVFLLEKLFFGYWIIIETALQFFQFRGFAALTKIIELIFRWRHSLPLVKKKTLVFKVV